MSTASSSANDVSSAVPGWLVPTTRVTSTFLAFGIVLQAYFAGSGVFDGNSDLINVHEMFGNIIFLVALAQIVITFIGMGRGVFSPNLPIVSVVIFVLIVVQISLGYAGREDISAIAYHLPNGVLLMGLCTWSAALAWRPNRA